jgi:hypothetical protein
MLRQFSLLPIAAAFFFLPTPGSGSTLLTGNISGTLNSTDVYVSAGNLTVPAGATLTLSAGAILKMSPGTALLVSGTLIAAGTSTQPVIITSLADDSVGGDTAADGPTSGKPGDWNGLSFGSGSVASSLQFASVRFATQITLTAASAEFSNVVISSMSGAAMVADLKSSLSGTGNSAFGSALNGILRPSDNVSQPQTWQNLGLPYVFQHSQLVFGVGASWTLSPGTILKLEDTQIQIRDRISAVGTSSQPIVFTSLKDDSAGGDTNGDGAGSAPARGDWDGLYVLGATASADLTETQVRFGGQISGRNIWVDAGGTLTLDHSGVSDAREDGVRIDNGASALIQGTTIQNNGGSGLQTSVAVPGHIELENNVFLNNAGWGAALSGNGPILTGNQFEGNGNQLLFVRASSTSAPTLRSNVFRNSPGVAIQIGSINLYLQDLGGNQALQNGLNGIELPAGSWTRSGTWSMTTMPYVARTGQLAFMPGARLTLVPGVVVKLQGGQLQFQEQLTAIGTSTAPIVFTSLRDDTVMGDTNGDKTASSPAASDWDVLLFYGASAVNSQLRYAQFRYGGSNSSTELQFSQGATAVIDHCRIERSGLTGVRVDNGSSIQIQDSTVGPNPQYGLLNNSASATIHNSIIQGNATAGVFTGATAVVDATGNYWGASSGPTVPSNPGGAGDAIVGNVNYVPFLSNSPGFNPDILPPRSELVLLGPSIAGNPIRITTSTWIAFKAVDDRSEIGDLQGVGVQTLQYSLDQAPFADFTTSFTITSDGPHRLRWFAKDLAGNTETVRFGDVALDISAPTTEIRFTPSAVVNQAGDIYISSSTSLAFSAHDSYSQIAFTQYRLNGSEFHPAPESITLPEGLQSVEFQSQDIAGNLEVLQSTTVRVDATAPLTLLSTAALTLGNNGIPVISSSTRLSLFATDPVSAGVASGIRTTFVAVDSDIPSPYSGHLSITVDGQHTLHFYSVDNTGNVEGVHSETVQVETDIPLTRVVFTGASFIGTSGLRFLSTSSQVAFEVTASAAGMPTTRYRLDDGPFAIYNAPFSPAAGPHRIDYQSDSALGVTEVLQSTNVFVDGTAPQTALSTGTFSVFHNGMPVINSSETLRLSAQDPLIGGLASGLREILLSVDSAPAVTYEYGLHPESEGAHSLRFFSRDQVGNSETPIDRMVVIDNTPPVTEIQFSTTTHQARLIAQDLSAGVAWTRWSLDGGSWTAYSDPILLAEGEHLLSVQSQDRVGNLETAHEAALRVETTGTVPVTVIDFVPAAYIDISSRVFIAAETQITLRVEPDGKAGAVTHYRIDGKDPFLTFTAPFSLPAGVHSIDVYSDWPSGAREIVQSLTVRVDAELPVSALKAGNPSLVVHSLGDLAKLDEAGESNEDEKEKALKGIGRGDVIVVSTYTRLQVLANDGNDGSGVKDSWVSVGTAAFTQVSGGFVLPGSKHLDVQTVRYYSRDHVLNTESIKTATVIVIMPKGKLKALLRRPWPLTIGSAAISSPGHLPISAAISGPLPISYHLEMAAGAQTQDGFHTLIDGTGEIDESAVIYDWDTRQLAGYYTLRLTATNGSGETSESIASVYIGYAGRSSFAAGAPGPDASFTLRQVFAFPNPARAGAKPTIHIEVGLADSVTLRIFDAAGRQVHQATLTGAPSIVNSAYAYEYEWDGTIPSGIYFYTVEAKSAGMETIHAKGKLAVVR